MNNNLLDLSKKISKNTLEILEDISAIAESLNIPFLLIGATARDLIMHDAFGINTIRATMDIDLGIYVADWDNYRKISNAMVNSGSYSPTKTIHRFLHINGLPIDILPFGLIGGPNNTITWPSNPDIKLSILGFDEAYHYAETIRIRSNPVLDIKIVTLCGLAMLKLISWNDKYPERQRDAQDLALIMGHYIDAGNKERFFAECGDLIKEEDFDYADASARLLGRDIASILNPNTRNTIIGILERETDEQHGYKLAVQMATKNMLYHDDNFEKYLRLIRQMKQGILER